MKQPFLPAPSRFAKPIVLLLLFLTALVPATFGQIGVNTPWTWMKGPKVPFDYGNPGTMGVEAAGNLPIARMSGNTFRDLNGNLWLFGGFSYLPAPMYFYFHDLWKFNPVTNNWTWMKGSQVPNSAGSYGARGVAAPTNNPGARMDAASWVDGNGNLWLFGGEGLDGSGGEGMLNDLWKFDVNTNTWTWIAGAPTRNATGNYGTQGVAGTGNVPPARSGMAYWADNAGNLWFYGGHDHQYQSKDDLWRYTIATNTWTWMKGNAVIAQTPTHGTIGVPAATNTPGSRSYSKAWIDAGNNLYLFGGAVGPNYYNDLWIYTPQNNQWTWINGDNLPFGHPVMGTPGVPHPQNKPGARVGSSAFTDMQGNFWLFGGYGNSSSSVNLAALNDLWKYSPASNQWTWIRGAELDAPGIYGTQGVPALTNKPGSKWNAMSWSAPSNDFWLFGGLGYGETPGWGEMNDLWMIGSSSIPLSTATVAAAPTDVLTIYPNPARSQIWFLLPEGGTVKATYRVVDASARTSLSGELVPSAANRYSVNVSKLPAGRYLLSVTTKKGTKQAAFIKE